MADSLISHRQVGISSRCCCRCLLFLLLTPNARVVSNRTLLYRAVWLGCVVASCRLLLLSMAPRFLRYRQPPGPGNTRQAVRYILPCARDAGHARQKVWEGIRIEAPDSNFGRLVGWQWVGAGFTGFNSSPLSIRLAIPPPRRWYTGATEPGSQRNREPDRHAAPVRQAPCSGPPLAPPVTTPRQLLQARPRPAVSGGTARGAHLPTLLAPLSLPGPALQALWHSASHVFPARVCLCLCLSAYPSLVCEYRRQKCVCVCVSVCRVFNLFLSFLHRPSCPCHLAFLPTTTALSLSPLLLSTLSCRVAVAATAAHPPPPPLALLVVRQDNLDTSFISSPCTIEFTFALRTPRLETHQDTPYIPPPPTSTIKKHRHFIPSRIIPAQLNPPATTKNVRLRAPGLS